MAVNKVEMRCEICGEMVPACGGMLHGETVLMARHLACNQEKRPMVFAVRTEGGTQTQNINGRCEDAPCCGCCTI